MGARGKRRAKEEEEEEEEASRRIKSNKNKYRQTVTMALMENVIVKKGQCNLNRNEGPQDFVRVEVEDGFFGMPKNSSFFESSRRGWRGLHKDL